MRAIGCSEKNHSVSRLSSGIRFPSTDGSLVKRQGADQIVSRRVIVCCEAGKHSSTNQQGGIYVVSGRAHQPYPVDYLVMANRAAVVLVSEPETAVKVIP